MHPYQQSRTHINIIVFGELLPRQARQTGIQRGAISDSSQIRTLANPRLTKLSKNINLIMFEPSPGRQP